MISDDLRKICLRHGAFALTAAQELRLPAQQKTEPPELSAGAAPVKRGTERWIWQLASIADKIGGYPF